MIRLHDWPERLHEYIEQERNQLFEWGARDCVTFACGGILAISGADHLSELKSKWTTEASAGKVLKRLGGLQVAVTKILGEPRSHLLAVRGDVLLIRNQGVEGLGLSIGRTWVSRGPDGLLFGLMSDALMSWAI